MDNVAWLLRFAKLATRRLVISILSRIAGHLLGALCIALPAWAVTRAAMGEAGDGFVLRVVLVFLVASSLKAVLRYLEQLYGHLAAFGLMGEMRVWMIDALLPQAPAITDGLGAAKIHTIAVRDIDRVEVFFAHTIAPAITAVLIPASATVAAGVLAGPAAALAMALVMIIGIVVPLIGSRSNAARAREVAALRADVSQSVADTVRLLDDIRQVGAEQARLDVVADKDRRLAAVLHASGNRTGVRAAVGQLRLWLGFLLVFVAALLAGAPLPMAAAAAALVLGSATSLETIERLATSLPAGLEATRKIRELAGGRPSVDEPENPAGPRDSSERVGFEGVTFSYPGRATVLDDVSFSLTPGAMLAVVGATGSGKSTIARLAQRHWDPAGTVTIDGVDARLLGSDRSYELVAVADQEPFIASGTVADNLAMAGTSVTDEEMVAACGLAGFELPLDRRVGQRGSALSGGQRQRLALARTIIRARQCGSVLVLDEATSHQDPITQDHLMERLSQAGFTLMVIAHRLSTIRDADQIIVMEGGRIAEHGTWGELADAGGAFSALLASERT